MEREGRKSVKKETPPPGPPSEPIPVSKPAATGRRTYISGNHLLSFEVTSSPGSMFGSSSGPTRRGRTARPGASFTKERFIHANFQFVAREEVVLDRHEFGVNPDAQLEWNDIEMVVVPAQQDVTCPICLDTPLAPQLTKCGHFFCWPCILRYAAATSMAGSGNWRKCPICFESVSVRQLKSVYFSQVTDFTTNSTEITAVGIPMVLIRGTTGTCRVRPVEQMNQTMTPESLSDLSPFEKITFVPRDFVEQNIISREIETLFERLNGMAENDPDRVYTELALTMVEDRRASLASEGASPRLSASEGNSECKSECKSEQKSEYKSEQKCEYKSERKSEGESDVLSEGASIFFHQSMDGQPFFLNPLSIRILRREFGTYSEMPAFLCPPVLEIEMSVMNEEIRKRHRYLQHVPTGCQFGLCEVDLSSIVSASVLAEFASELKAKENTRKSKAAKEAKISAAALRKEQQLYDLRTSVDSGRASPSSLPGVATGIFGAFAMNYENFPLPRAAEEEEPSSAIPITEPAKSVTSGLASSFASIAATSPDGFIIVTSDSSPPQVNFSFGEGDVNRESDPTGKKGKRIVLVNNLQRRQS
ncbi:putative e3 ubiquitin ligase [Paramicrosporidium saccamoebae]|uniref:Putative e3 ubiquitin ligase n=1 Tax=Paramicrosporidium saccamoebae TaxID=1246581 RepID=A0A2H9TLA0_9FUNG|nr:putative e3 ubiquitin ligase [Paramicrosporidium saccamoebae]